MPSTSFFAPPQPKRRPWLIFALAVLALLAGGLVYRQLSRPATAAPEPPAAPSSPAASSLQPGEEAPAPAGAGESIASAPRAAIAPPPPPLPSPSDAVEPPAPAAPAAIPARGAGLQRGQARPPLDAAVLRELLANPRIQELRSFGKRPTAEAFSKAAAALEAETRSGALKAELVQPFVAFVEAGVAYTAGDDAGAATALEEALEDERIFLAIGPGSPIQLFAPKVRAAGEFADWELAVAFGDPRRSAAAALDSRLGADPRRQLARAFVHRLDRQPLQVVEKAGPAYHAFLAAGSRELAAVAAELVAEAFGSEGRLDDALLWYRKALETRSDFTTAILLQATARLREMRRPEESARLLQLACDNGSQLACERLERPRRRPLRPGGK